jgi:CRP-like cAMP-binding protein
LYLWGVSAAAADLAAELRGVGPFRQLSPDRIHRLAEQAARREVPAGEYVWRRGEAPRSFIVVREGLVAVQRDTAEGESVLLALFGPGDTLCVVPALQHMPFPADAVAVAERTVVLSVAAAPILDALDRDAELAAAVNRALLEHTTSLRSKIDIVSAGTVPRRVAALLLHLARRFGRVLDDGTIEIHPAATREQIGRLVNARTETVIRIMSRWSKAGWIEGVVPTLRLLRADMLRRIAPDAPGATAPGR